jgi:hypothetical protein
LVLKLHIIIIAIILARSPKDFIEHYIPELLYENDALPIKVYVSNNAMMTVDRFLPLLRFYYTATFYKQQYLVSPNSSISNVSTVSATPTPPMSPVLSINSTNSSIPSPTPPARDIRHELEELGVQLGTAILPLHCESVPDSVQLVNDLKRMRDEKIATDVTINLVSNNDDTSTNADSCSTIPSLLSTCSAFAAAPAADDQEDISFRAHRFILAAQSSYFYALFCAQFHEASSSNVHLTHDLFNEAIIDVILNYFYTGKVIVTPLNYDTTKQSSPLQRKLQHNKHALRVVQKAFYAADYLGHMETLGQALLCEMETLCHQFKCVCPECAVLLPSMLAWSDKHVDEVPKLRRALILLYCDPVHSLPPLWSQRPFALLVTSMVPSAASLGEETLDAVMKQEPLFRARAPKTLVHEIEERTFYNVTKHNAIHVLHSLHLCLSQIRSADPNPSWSRPALDLVNPILHYTVSMVSQHFDFYCVEYPILLSCVDGIGAGFSVDFLDFLLCHVLNEGIQASNAGVIYQGVVRDLFGRQEVVKNMAIDDVLIKARIRCATFISKNWTKVKSQGGFRTLEKSTMRQLAEDINVPYRSLTKLFDSEFSNIFSFKPKKSKKLALNNDDKNWNNGSNFSRRLSLGQLITRSTSPGVSSSRSNSSRITNRPRAVSTESVLTAGLRRYRYDNPTTPANMENAPLINLLHHETLEIQRRLEQEDLDRKYNNNKNIAPATTITPPHPTAAEYIRPVLRTTSSFTSLTDQLLPVDAIVPLKKSKTNSKINDDNDEASRPSRLKFELPTTPLRSRSLSNNIPPISPSSSSSSAQVAMSAYLSPQSTKNRQQCQRGGKSGRGKPRWSIGSDEDENAPLPVLGDKIELLRRPLPTMGTIKYIGPVEFADGPYIGVELESRCK